MPQSGFSERLAQAQNEMRVEAQMRLLLNQVSPDSRLSILMRLTLEAEQFAGSREPTRAPTPEATISQQDAAVQPPAGTISATLEKMLADAENGLTAADVAQRLYSGRDAAEGKHAARSMLRHLKTRGIAKPLGDRWYLMSRLPKTAARKRPLEARRHSDRTIGEIIQGAIRKAGSSLTKRDLVEAVRKASPKTTSKHVNSEVYRQVHLGNLVKLPDQNGNMLYSLPTNGGASK